MRIHYNSPVILTFALISIIVLILDQSSGHILTRNFFTVYPTFNFASPVDYFRIFSHIFGHKNWSHLMGNFSFILLIGPMLEEKYQSGSMLLMILITSLFTGFLNVVFFSTGLLGASGIVFMLILLSSFANFRTGKIPLTFILILLIFLTKEIADVFANDDISQFAHIIGGICGSIFGFLLVKAK